MSSWTATELESAMMNHTHWYEPWVDYKGNSREGYNIDWASWDEWLECGTGDAGVEVEGFGLVELVVDFGGEGQGEERYLVFKVTSSQLESPRYFRVDGYYASYEGSTFDGDLREVAPQKKEITVYE